MRKIIKLSWPLAVGMINNAVLQFTDRAFLAHESMAALEASLAAAMLSLVILGFFQSVVAYSGTFVAQYVGAKDSVGATRSYHAGTFLAFISGLASILMLPLGWWVMDTFAADVSIAELQRTYYTICTAGGFFLFAQMAAQGFFTGYGKTRIIFAVNVIGNLVNVALDYLLIFGKFGCPHLGLAGAAYATVISTAVEWLILIIAARRHTNKVPRIFTRESLALVGKILKFGLPSGAYAFLNLISFTIFVFVIGLVGHVEAAVANACFTVNYLLFAPMEGFAMGAATLVGQCQGAGDSRGASRYAIKTVVLGVSIVFVLSLAALAAHYPLLEMFAPKDGELARRFHELGFTLFVLMSLWQVFDAADIIIGGALKGAGDTKFVFWWMFFCSFVLWLPLVFVVRAFRNTMPALWCTMIVYVITICIGSSVRFYRGKWKNHKLV